MYEEQVDECGVSYVNRFRIIYAFKYLGPWSVHLSRSTIPLFKNDMTRINSSIHIISRQYSIFSVIAWNVLLHWQQRVTDYMLGDCKNKKSRDIPLAQDQCYTTVIFVCHTY